jgi:hypothetical protein
MLALSPEDFELFIAHVFTCAGYYLQHMVRKKYPEGHDVDLDLYASKGTTGGRQLIARVEVRRYTSRTLITLLAVRELTGMLHIAQGIPGYLYTGSSVCASASQHE